MAARMSVPTSYDVSTEWCRISKISVTDVLRHCLDFSLGGPQVGTNPVQQCCLRLKVITDIGSM
eukprot:3630987-Karenia_brevis.AAC.1